jgi:hypothetical protein
MVLRPTPDVGLRVEELGTGTEGLASRIHAEVTRPIDVRGDPLFRPVLYRTSATSSILLLVLHHIIGDGWSLRLLNRYISDAYNARVLGAPPLQASVPRQYFDYARFQRDSWSAQNAGLADYWAGQLTALERTARLPTAPLRHRGPESESAVVTASIPQDQALALRAFATAHGATPFMVALTGFAVALARACESATDVLIGVPYAARNDPRFADVIGCFTQTLPIRTDLSSAVTFEDALRNVRSALLSAIEHVPMASSRLWDLLDVDRAPLPTPLCETVFVDAGPEPKLNLTGITSSAFPISFHPAAARLLVEWHGSKRSPYLRQISRSPDIDAEFNRTILDLSLDIISRALRASTFG